TFTDQEKDKLKAGSTIKKPLHNSSKNGFYGGSGYTLIDAPVEAVWKAILDYPVYNKVFAATSKVSELSKRGNKSLVHYEMGYKYLSLEYYLEVTRDVSNYTISFEMLNDKPHDLTSAKGYWKLFPQAGGRTLVAYVVSAQVPMGIVNLMKDDWHSLVERNLIGAPNDLKIWLSSANGKKYFQNTAKN
ncbi:MAG: SRPBCC family protein, partial [Deltaproteobacteria bacterium]|nr:SRPBCC family protein [Deltaproteobacteria bacterium]